MSEKKIGQFTERDFGNDLRDGRGKMSLKSAPPSKQ
jgi:hypothetical protein